MVMGTHHDSVKDGGAVGLLGGAETSRRAATAPRRQPPHGVGKRWRQSPSLTRQSPSALARFLAEKGKHLRREAAGLPRARRCNKLGSDVFTLDELRQITNNFSDDQLIGEGAFGKVYEGVLRNGDKIAVKRFASTITGLHDVQYENEAQHLMRLKHPNIVQLLGYCSETEIKLVRHNGTFVRAEQPERLLCLEYMPKGSLRGHLSDETSGLEWNTRYKIIEGICYGLHYLHEEWEATPIIHMDLKPANILMDDNMVPKIADFGLSRLFGEDQTRTCTTSRKGTPGYMAPEYLEKGVITKKFDIFSLGVIIIEIITGLKDYPIDDTETTSQQYIDLVLNKWRHRLRKAQGYTSQDIDYQQIKKCIQIGLLCVKFDRVKRPTINQIIKMLEGSDEAYQNERESALEGAGDSSNIIAKKMNTDPMRPLKKSRTGTPSPLPTFKVRKEKLGDRITALQQLVSPFGKDDEENEEEGGLSKSGKELKKLLGRAAGLNESDVDEDEEDDDQEDESSPVLAPKQKDQAKDEPVDNSPAKPTPLGHARGTPPASKSKQKRKSGVDDAKTSNGAASKKAKDTKASGLKEEASSSAKPASKIPASSKSGTNVSPVTEDEIRSVLLAVAPVTTQDLVARFKSRLRGSEDKNAFAEILKKISKIQKTNGHNYVVLRDDKK